MKNFSSPGVLFRICLIAPAVVAVFSFLTVALSRVAFPFALEWLEAGTYTHVARVLEGKPIYAAPSYEFIAMIYPPLYYYVAAPLAGLTGNIMLSIHLVSMGSALAAFLLLYGICRVRRLPRSLSFLAVGFAAASYKATGFWFDIGRVDMLFMALLLAAVLLVTLRPRREGVTGVAAGVALALAFATKQQAVVALPFLVFVLLLERRWKKALAFAGSAALLMALFVWGLAAASENWFLFYVFTLPGSAPASAAWFADTWRILLWPAFWPLVALILLGVTLALLGNHRRDNLPRLVSLALLVLPLLIMSYLSLAKQWGYVNGFLPAAFGLALAGAEAVFYAMQIPLTPRWVRAVVLGLALALVWLQFGVSRYDPRTQIPSAANVTAGYQALDTINHAPAPIFAPTDSYLLDMIGQPMHFQASALSDITLAARYNPKVEEVLNRYQAGISGPYLRGNAAAAVLAEPNWYREVFNEENGYTCESLTDDGEMLVTMTGAKHALGELCVLH